MLARWDGGTQDAHQILRYAHVHHAPGAAIHSEWLGGRKRDAIRIDEPTMIVPGVEKFACELTVGVLKLEQVPHLLPFPFEQATPPQFFLSQSGNLLFAESAARDLGRLSLQDALRLVHLYAERQSPKFEPAARRWLARYIDDSSPRLRDLAKVAASLASREFDQAELKHAGDTSLPPRTAV